jgi:uncharacterized membrane protein
MKFIPTVELPQIAIVGAMLAISVASWSTAPSRIGVHFGIGGRA